jgi:hypothetical protein
MRRLVMIVTLLVSMGAFYAMSQSLEPKWAGSVSLIVVDGDSIAVPAEKANVKVKTANSVGRLLVGIGNTTSKVVVAGPSSTTQLKADAPVLILVKCKDNETDPMSFIQVVKFDEKKKERVTELANVNWVGNVSEGNMKLMPYEAESYGKSSYLLKMEPVAGEYGVRILNPNEKDEKVTIFHCFGVR